MRDLVGKPWAVPCDPPHSFDCWELTRHVRKTAFEIDTPSVVDREKRRPVDRQHITTPPSGWVRLDRPVIGCVARIGRSHVGVYLGRDRIIHSALGKGVGINRVEELTPEEVTYWERYDG